MFKYKITNYEFLVIKCSIKFEPKLFLHYVVVIKPVFNTIIRCLCIILLISIMPFRFAYQQWTWVVLLISINL